MQVLLGSEILQFAVLVSRSVFKPAKEEEKVANPNVLIVEMTLCVPGLAEDLTPAFFAWVALPIEIRVEVSFLVVEFVIMQLVNYLPDRLSIESHVIIKNAILAFRFLLWRDGNRYGEQFPARQYWAWLCSLKATVKTFSTQYDFHKICSFL